MREQDESLSLEAKLLSYFPVSKDFSTEILRLFLESFIKISLESLTKISLESFIKMDLQTKFNPTTGELTINWTIDNASNLLSTDLSKKVKSSAFVHPVDESINWILEFGTDCIPGYCGLFLNKQSTSKVTVLCRMGFNEEVKFSFVRYGNDDGLWGCPKLVPITALKMSSNHSVIGSDDSLHLIVVLKFLFRGHLIGSSIEQDITQCLYDLFKKQQVHEVTFLLKDEKSINAHKAVLMTQSSEFRRRIEEHKNSEATIEIRVDEEIDYFIFKVVLDFMYGKKLQTKSVTKVVKLFTTAQLYSIPRLKDECIKLLEKLIDKDNVAETLLYKPIRNCEKIIKICLEIIRKSPREQIKDWEHLCEDQEVLYMTFNNLNLIQGPEISLDSQNTHF